VFQSVQWGLFAVRLRVVVSKMFFRKVNAKRRFSNLLELQPEFSEEVLAFDENSADAFKESTISSFSRYLEYANISLSPYLVGIVLATVSISFLGLSFFLFPVYLAPLFVLLLGVAVYVFLEKRVEEKAGEFSSEYPAVLMATASSVKAGMTPYDALERSIRLLPKTSLVRIQIEKLLIDLRKGIPRHHAIQGFGKGVRLPDVKLFQNAFNLVLDHGGRFAPTLERLADVCRDRSTLVRAANVSTATMRMTANILLAVAPIILGLVAVRTENFWNMFFNDPVANPLAMTGVLVIGLSYVSLLKMSSFRP